MDSLTLGLIGLGIGIIVLVFAPLAFYTMAVASIVGFIIAGAILDESKMNYRLNKHIVHEDIITGCWGKKKILNSDVPIYKKMAKLYAVDDTYYNESRKRNMPNSKKIIEKIDSDQYTNMLVRAHLGIEPNFKDFRDIDNFLDNLKWKDVSKTLVEVVNINRNCGHIEKVYEIKNSFTGKIKKFFHERQAFDLWYNKAAHCNGPKEILFTEEQIIIMSTCPDPNEFNILKVKRCL